MAEKGTGADGNTLIGLGRGGGSVVDVPSTESPPAAVEEFRTAEGSTSLSVGQATDVMAIPPIPTPYPEVDIPDTEPRAEAIQAPERDADNGAIGGRYFLQQEIGKGGMARVFSARHSNLGRVFALKQIHADLSRDADLRNRFLREARLASSLSHPNIVSVVDFGEDPDMGAYMVMELLDGAPLSERLKRKTLMSIRMACDLTSQIADALHYIHGKGIVHCDIKPENILLCKMPTKQRSKWCIKLLDFGLAHAQSSNQSLRNSINGTPPYMAPETVQGHAPTPSADIYSLGIVLYELITGRPPFEGHFTHIMRAHVQEPPPPPSSVCDREIDERLENLILKALAKDPADRHPDMGAFIFELQTLMDMLGFGHRRRSRPATGASAPKAFTVAEMAFDSSPLAMAVIRVSGEFETCNEQFRRFLDPHANDREQRTMQNLEATVLSTMFPSLLADVKQCLHHDVCQILRAELPTDNGHADLLSVTLSPMPRSTDLVLVSLSRSSLTA